MSGNMKKKLVCISWIDADSTSGWTADRPENDKAVILKTYGLLVRRTKLWVIHADTFDRESNHWSGLGRIPVGIVRSVKTIALVDV